MTRFYSSVEQTLYDLQQTFRKWGVLRYQAKRERAKSETAVVTFTHASGTEVTLASSACGSYASNLRALWQSLDQARKDEARGLGSIARSLYLQLPAPAQTEAATPTQLDPFAVLGCAEEQGLDYAEYRYRRKVKQSHPDVTPGADLTPEMFRLNWAIQLVRERLGATVSR